MFKENLEDYPFENIDIALQRIDGYLENLEKMELESKCPLDIESGLYMAARGLERLKEEVENYDYRFFEQTKKGWKKDYFLAVKRCDDFMLLIRDKFQRTGQFRIQLLKELDALETRYFNNDKSAVDEAIRLIEKPVEEEVKVEKKKVKEKPIEERRIKDEEVDVALKRINGYLRDLDNMESNKTMEVSTGLYLAGLGLERLRNEVKKYRFFDRTNKEFRKGYFLAVKRCDNFMSLIMNKFFHLNSSQFVEELVDLNDKYHDEEILVDEIIRLIEKPVDQEEKVVKITKDQEQETEIIVVTENQEVTKDQIIEVTAEQDVEVTEEQDVTEEEVVESREWKEFNLFEEPVMALENNNQSVDIGEKKEDSLSGIIKELANNAVTKIRNIVNSIRDFLGGLFEKVAQMIV